MLAPDFRDPEGRLYVARHVARYGDADQAMEQLDAIVADGFSWRRPRDRTTLPPTSHTVIAIGPLIS
jgi:hypothetical protein